MKYKTFDELSYVTDVLIFTAGYSMVFSPDFDYFAAFYLDLLKKRCKREGQPYPPSAYSFDNKGRIFLKF